MVVLVLSACPPGLRGFLTRWLMEISAGVFVGHVSRRVRDRVWERTVEMVGKGRALMVFPARNEQRLDFLVHGHHWEPVDFDGIKLMLRPDSRRRAAGPRDGSGNGPSTKTGWSNAARRRRYS